jgi:acyl transferase domain-containing protein/acyl carrier protein
MKPSAIAIVGMAGRFPGASNLTEFWQNLRDGVESIRDRSDAELLASGASPEELASPEYVRRASLLDGVPMFDASFFGFSPRDAAIMDPQHRHFLECAWEAFEDAGHPPQRFDGSVGVFAGSGLNSYLIHNLLANRRLLETTGLFQLKQTGNDKDVLATRVSYQFDLRGPSINVQTACSTSLVAVHLACQSLLNQECDMALAGGVTIEIPHGLGYLYREGEILSRDGHCRAFDASSSGTVFGSGLGIVVLRRLEDALADHDHIRAVILGTAVNNDGARKVGYLAPSVEGQAEVIAEALEFAGVSADEISYVETHGTGTIVGDPIEVRALTQAFRKSTARSGYCGIGSLKTNIGHLDAAAGVASLIKTVLALEHAHIPPSLHFKMPNPHLALKDSPFYVNSRLTDWDSNGSARRCGVTSLGIGGTNAHVVLEEAPRQSVRRQQKSHQLLTASAKTKSAADRALANLIAHLHEHPEVNLDDAAFTCQLGRHLFPHRHALVVEDTPQTVVTLAERYSKEAIVGVTGTSAPQVVFLFSGQGSQHVDMGRELYKCEPVFRETLDTCARELQSHLGIDLLQALYPPEEEREVAAAKLNETWLTQPALFSIEYAIARWWISLGVKPAAMLGHSIGEYVAACLAGVFSLEDALAIVALRGRMIFELPSGSMLAVPLSPGELPLSGSLSLAAVNHPSLCAVSGPTDEIAALEERLAIQGTACRRLYTSHAFHSAMMEPILGAFEERLRGIAFRQPHIPYLSNVTGTWIRAEEAMSSAYWARHIRQTVHFSDGLAELLRTPDQILLEVGPGSTLTSLARQQGGASSKALQTLPHPREAVSDYRCALQTLGQLWVSGVEVEWSKLHAPHSAQRIPLPTYPFEHQKFWIDPDKARATLAPTSTPAQDVEDGLFYRRTWRPAPLPANSGREASCWIIFRDALGLGEAIGAQLKAAGRDVVLVDPGSGFKQSSGNRYTVRPGAREDYDALLSSVIKSGLLPQEILHLWSVQPLRSDAPLDETLARSFYSPLYLAQALGAQDLTSVEIAFVSNRLQQVGAEPVHIPARAVLVGPARVIPEELPGIVCCAVDVDFESGQAGDCAAQVIAEMEAIRESAVVAYREGQRFEESLDRFDLSAAPEQHRLKRGGVYLITGGAGGIGLVVAEHLAREFNARLVLVSRSTLPSEAQWEAFLSDSSQTERDKERIRKLLEIRSVAGGLLLAQADVTDLNQMREVVARAHKVFGKIDGAFQAAGILDDGPLMLKTAPAAARVLAPKIRGTMVLEEALRDEPLSCFVLFSSISSILPFAGQIDYAAANAFLDSFALSRGPAVTVVNWEAWREVGMAARLASRNPLLEERLHRSTNEIVFASQLKAEKQWLLSDHRLKNGKVLIPGTGYLEMAAEALGGGSSRGAVEFKDVYFLAPLSLEGSESKELRVQLQRDERGGTNAGAYNFSILARDGRWIEHSSGRIAPCLTRPIVEIDSSAILARCSNRVIDFDEQHRTRQEQYFDFGPRWHSLKHLCIGDKEGLAELELHEEFSAEASAFRMHPALFDMATGCSLYLTDGYEESDDLYLPLSYKRICLYRPVPPRLFSHIRARQENAARGEVARFDITLFDETNQVIAEIEGFAMRRIADPARAADEKASVREAMGSSAVQPIEIVERPGISPLDGARALVRILLAETPNGMIVASQHIEELRRHSAVSQSQVASSVVPPQSVEQTLAGWFQDLLGVQKVELDDDFFDLGGHSLISVRLFAKIKSAYQTDLDLAVLFEARTVRLLADMIRKARQPGAVEDKKYP